MSPHTRQSTSTRFVGTLSNFRDFVQHPLLCDCYPPPPCPGAEHHNKWNNHSTAASCNSELHDAHRSAVRIVILIENARSMHIVMHMQQLRNSRAHPASNTHPLQKMTSASVPSHNSFCLTKVSSNLSAAENYAALPVQRPLTLLQTLDVRVLSEVQPTRSHHLPLVSLCRLPSESTGNDLACSCPSGIYAFVRQVSKNMYVRCRPIVVRKRATLYAEMVEEGLALCHRG